MAQGFDLGTAFGDVSSAIASGIFDPQGSNFTEFKPVAPKAPTPSDLLDNVFSNARSVGKGGSSDLAKGAAVALPTADGVATAGAQVSAAGTLVSKWLIRGTVILLGFIFVAVGLSMFKTGQAITVKVKQAVQG